MKIRGLVRLFLFMVTVVFIFDTGRFYAPDAASAILIGSFFLGLLVAVFLDRFFDWFWRWPSGVRNVGWFGIGAAFVGGFSPFWPEAQRWSLWLGLFSLWVVWKSQTMVPPARLDEMPDVF